MPRLKARTDFEKDKIISPFYGGGRISLFTDSLFVCAHNQLVNFVDVVSGKIAACAKHDYEDHISTFCFTSEFLVTISKSLLVKLFLLDSISGFESMQNWEQVSLTCERTWKSVHRLPVVCCAMEDSGVLLASGSTDCSVKVYDLAQQYHTHNIKGSAPVKKTLFWMLHDKHLLLLTTFDDGKLQITHLLSKSCLANVDAHIGSILDVQLSPDSKFFVTIGRDCLAIVWKPGKLDLKADKKSMELGKQQIAIKEMAEALIIPLPCQVGVELIHGANVSKKNIFITVGERGVFKLWDTVGNCLLAFGKLSDGKENDDTYLASIRAMEQRGHHFIAASYSNDVFIYNLKTFKIIKSLSANVQEICCCCFVGLDRSLLAVVANSKFLKLLNLDTLDVKVLPGHKDVIISARSSSDGKMVATTSKDRTGALWLFNEQQRTLNCFAYMIGHTMDVLDVSFSTDSKFLCTVAEDCTLKTWKLGFNSSCQSFDDLEVKALKCKWTLKAHDKQINCCKVSPNNQLIATGSYDKLVKVWNYETRDLNCLLIGHRKGVWAVDFSTADQLLASASGDGTAKLWNLANATCLATFEGHDCAVIQVVYFNESSQLSTSATDGIVKIWDLKTSECVATLDGHTDKVWSLCVHETPKEGSKAYKSDMVMVSAGADANIVVWKDVTQLNKVNKADQQNSIITQMQQMQNLLMNENFIGAIKLAISLNQPFKVYSVLETVLASPDESILKELEKTIADLSECDVTQVLEFCVIWNSNSKNCLCSQLVMELVFKTWHPQKLLALADIRQLVENLLCYQERHLDRLERMEKNSSLLHFTNFCANDVSMPQTET